MKKLNPYLFVYGTLLSRGNDSASLMNECLFFCKGKFAGELYDLGEYPGAVLAKEGDDYVYGEVVFMNNPSSTLALLDDYEGFGADQEQPNLFVRELIAIETGEGKIECWVYLYNLSVRGAKRIVSGMYFNL